jgi:hypothetical protein
VSFGFLSFVSSVLLRILVRERLGLVSDRLYFNESVRVWLGDRSRRHRRRGDEPKSGSERLPLQTTNNVYFLVVRSEPAALATDVR